MNFQTSTWAAEHVKDFSGTCDCMQVREALQKFEERLWNIVRDFARLARANPAQLVLALRVIELQEIVDAQLKDSAGGCLISSTTGSPCLDELSVAGRLPCWIPLVCHARMQPVLDPSCLHHPASLPCKATTLAQKWTCPNLLSLCYCSWPAHDADAQAEFEQDQAQALNRAAAVQARRS